MEKMDIVYRFLEFLGVAIAGGWVSHILTVRSRVRGARAEAGKAEASVKADEIDNIQSIVEKVYKPTIDTLTRQVADLREEVKQVRRENEELKAENDQLRDALREIKPDIVQSKRSINAQNQARNERGQFCRTGE
jgi:regulator of replication initiation timing